MSASSNKQRKTLSLIFSINPLSVKFLVTVDDEDHRSDDSVVEVLENVPSTEWEKYPYQFNSMEQHHESKE